MSQNCRSVRGVFLLIALLAATTAGQTLTNRCVTWMFRNNLPFNVDDLHLTFAPIAGATFVLEDVVLPPPGLTGGTGCPTPGYTWNCTGGPVINIFFAAFGIDPGKWVSVTVSTTAGLPALTSAMWNFFPGPGSPAEIYQPPHVVLNELTTANTDWIELYNYGPSIDVGGFRVEVREDPAAVSTIFTFPTPFILLTCSRVVLSESAAAPALATCPVGSTLVFNPGTVPPVLPIPWNTIDNGAVYLIAPPAIAGGPERPVDALAFGYFQRALNLHPDFPVSDPLQNYVDDSPEQVTLYRMETCLRSTADSWNNQRIPSTILNGGASTAPISPATPGCPNPGECNSFFSCPGPPGLVLRVSKCPLVIHADGLVPGTEVFILASTDVRETQGSGTLGGLNPFSNLLYSLFTSNFSAPFFREVAFLPSPCPGVAAKETSFGFLPGLDVCIELSAYGLVRGQGAAAAIVPMVSNVVRVP